MGLRELQGRSGGQVQLWPCAERALWPLAQHLTVHPEFLIGTWMLSSEAARSCRQRSVLSFGAHVPPSAKHAFLSEGPRELPVA